MTNIQKANHSYSLCMSCKADAPAHDALWQSDADSLERAWFCPKCFPAWYAEKGERVVHVNKVEGVVPKRYRIRHTPKERKRVNKATVLKVNGFEATLGDLARSWLEKADRFTSAPWQSPESSLDPADFAKVCLINLNEPGADPVKAKMKLPIKSTPAGPVNLNALRNAAARLPQTDAPEEVKRAAARKLIKLMRSAGIEVGPATLALANMEKEETVEKSWLMELIEKQDEKQIVFGIILRANVPDSQGDILTPEVIEDIATKYMAHQLGKADWLHKTEIPRNEAVLVQSFISPIDFEWNGVQIKKHDWLGGMWIPDKEKWQAVKKGEVRAFSIRGMGRRTPVAT